jgi:hypothetical protein
MAVKEREFRSGAGALFISVLGLGDQTGAEAFSTEGSSAADCLDEVTAALSLPVSFSSIWKGVDNCAEAEGRPSVDNNPG